jgi:hypothetical protein
MTSKLIGGFAAIGLCALFQADALHAQQCSTATTTGKYVVVCDGYLSPAANAPLVPAKILGTAVIDYDGQIKGLATVSIGGQILSQTVLGKEKVNSDCTGSVTYAQTISGQPGSPLNVTFIISNYCDRIDGLVTDPGTTLSCVLRRTSLNVFAAMVPHSVTEMSRPASVAGCKIQAGLTPLETASSKTWPAMSGTSQDESR